MDRPAPRISVIIPNLNQAEYLESAICSVLDQGHEDLELVVVDGGSCDGSLDMIRAYEDQIDHWQSVWDSGPAEAINTALSWITGDIVGILDADDTYLPHALAEAARGLSDGAEWAVGQAVRVDESFEYLDDLPSRPPSSLSAFLTADAGPLPGSATFYRTALLKAVGGFDSGLKLAYGHDLHARLFAARRMPAVLRPAVAAVREHDASLSATHGLACGHEFAEAAERYASHLAPTPRYLLWRCCDETRRIYAAADLQISQDPGSRVIWLQLLKRPEWLARSDYRRKLLQNLGENSAEAPQTMTHPQPSDHRDRRAA
jgi:glycosyltransferase involved in cell wall biosynthesis